MQFKLANAPLPSQKRFAHFKNVISPFELLNFLRKFCARLDMAPVTRIVVHTVVCTRGDHMPHTSQYRRGGGAAARVLAKIH